MRLWRAVSPAEAADVARGGRLRPSSGSMEGKWFAETSADAVEWGRRFYGPGEFDVVVADGGDDAASGWFRLASLDGIGPARWAEPDQLAAVTIIEVLRVP